MGQVLATVDAIAQMSAVPGLRARVQRHVLGVLETAVQAANLPGGLVDQHAPLVAGVGDYEVTYTLDLEKSWATILKVESRERARRFARGPRSCS